MPTSIGLVVDTETTGLSNRDEIIEFAAIAFEFDPNTGIINKRLDEYSGLREPKVLCDPEALRIHGITPGMTRGRSLDKSRILELFTRTQIVIAHNAAFDQAFLQRLFADLPEKPWACTLRQILWDWEGYFQTNLSAIAKHYGISQEITHRARSDAEVVFQLLSKPNCLNVPHIKQLNDRINRPSLTLKFRHQHTKRALRLTVFMQEDEILVRSDLGDRLKLWTRPDYEFINAYVKGSIGGRGRALQFSKSKNRTLLSLCLSNRRVELVVSQRTESLVEFEVCMEDDRTH